MQMFLEYYGLFEQPFGVTPDPRFLYLGPKHREALASLVYGTEASRGFLALIAEPGMGKTSLLFQYLECLHNKARTALVFQTDCGSREFIRHILIDLGLDVSGKDLPAMHEMLNRLLMEEMRAGRSFVLVIDEAQNLEEKVLESVRLLSNFETPWMKLMQIVIAGQPQLADRLTKPSMAQLRQRISMVIRIEPFTPEETNAYIDHRLGVAGYKGPSLFTAGGRLLIAECSRGIPRNINNICFNAMSLACALKRKTIDRDIILEVLADLEFGSLNREKVVISKSEEEPKRDVSRNLPKVEREPLFRGRLLRLAAVSAFLFALSWPVIPLNREETQATAWSVALPVPAHPAVSVTQAKAETTYERGIQVLSQQVGTQSLRPTKNTSGAFRSITVIPGLTLSEISVENFGKYNGEIIRKIHELNPWLIDPNHVQPGQKIRIPLVREVSRDVYPSFEQASDARDVGPEKP